MPSDITKVTPNLALPEHLQGAQVEGVAELADLVRPPFIKIVQKQSDDLLLAAFKAGDTIIQPQQALITEKTEPFQFVPLFHYREWCTWAPIEMKGQVPAILARTLNMEDQLAKKAMSVDLREEKGYDFDGKKMDVTHSEHLNFVVALYNHDFSGDPMIMSFSKAEWKTGAKFAGLIKMRKASIYDCVFNAVVSDIPRSNNYGSWFGFDITNPTEVSPWVTKEEHDVFGKLHRELKEHHDKGRLQATYDASPKSDEDNESSEVEVDATSEF